MISIGLLRGDGGEPVVVEGLPEPVVLTLPPGAREGALSCAYLDESSRRGRVSEGRSPRDVLPASLRLDWLSQPVTQPFSGRSGPRERSAFEPAPASGMADRIGTP